MRWCVSTWLSPHVTLFSGPALACTAQAQACGRWRVNILNGTTPLFVGPRRCLDGRRPIHVRSTHDNARVSKPEEPRERMNDRVATWVRSSRRIFDQLACRVGHILPDVVLTKSTWECTLALKVPIVKFPQVTVKLELVFYNCTRAVC